jgi:S1-C subfamily serine protease
VPDSSSRSIEGPTGHRSAPASSVFVGLFLASLALPSSVQAQEPAPKPVEIDPADLKAARRFEARQMTLIRRLSPSVAAVFKEGEPGGGSGVIVDPRGYVLTNFHVSGTSKRLRVGLNDGRSYRARLLGIDPGGDIALLRFDAGQRKRWPSVPLGNSDLVRPGARVYAMGNPFLLAEDFSPTVTQGVVSGIHRYRTGSGSTDLVYGDCVQLDASINPGNSGGPLFSAEGELLGINGLGGFRPDRVRINVGVGFAASVTQIKNFLLDLRACRQCYHGTMNATVKDLTRGGKTPRPTVDSITKTSKAYLAGLRLGDVVKEFQGEAIRSQNQLLARISRLPANRRIRLVVERASEEGGAPKVLTFTFRLGTLWSGPQQGQWAGDSKLIKRETAEVLASYRATRPPLNWVRRERLQAGGKLVERVVRVRGRQIRVETGVGAQRLVEVFEGSNGWQQRGEGPVSDLLPARRDELGGTATALAAVAHPQGLALVNEIVFTGGEWIYERPAIRLEVRDRAGRQRKVYLDAESLTLVGFAAPGPDDRWIEETYLVTPKGTRIRRVDDESAKLLQEVEVLEFRREAQDAKLFKRPGRGS